jgi:acetyltransferase-like isoleucine patch superfamily enzyme
MRGLIDRCLEHFARRRLRTVHRAGIAPTAKVKYRRIKLHPNSRLTIGAGSIVEGTLVSERDGAEIIIGENTFIGNSLIASATRIEIGSDVLMAWGCNVVDHNSHPVAWSERSNDVKNWYAGKKDWSHVITQPVRIADKCWVGFNVAILKGIQVGEGAVIGAGSVVTKDIPPWTVVGGNPAKIIREIPIEDR